MARTPEVVTVDPDLSSRADMKRALQMAHFTVTGEAGYGIEAVTVAQEKLPDVFLVSVEEPVARALQTIESLADAVPGAPAIVYSTMADAASVRRAMVSGARDYLIKPVRPEELVRSIHGVLEQEERKRMRLAGQTMEGAPGTASASDSMVWRARATGSSMETRKTSGSLSWATVTASMP